MIEKVVRVIMEIFGISIAPGKGLKENFKDLGGESEINEKSLGKGSHGCH